MGTTQGRPLCAGEDGGCPPDGRQPGNVDFFRSLTPGLVPAQLYPSPGPWPCPVPRLHCPLLGFPFGTVGVCSSQLVTMTLSHVRNLLDNLDIPNLYDGQCWWLSSHGGCRLGGFLYISATFLESGSLPMLQLVLPCPSVIGCVNLCWYTWLGFLAFVACRCR